jgi:hypothetical protein
MLRGVADMLSFSCHYSHRALAVGLPCDHARLHLPGVLGSIWWRTGRITGRSSDERYPSGDDRPGSQHTVPKRNMNGASAHRIMKHRKAPYTIALQLEAWTDKKSRIMERSGQWLENGMQLREGFSGNPIKRLQVLLLKARRAVIALIRNA